MKFAASLHWPVSIARTMPSKKTAGGQGKAVGCVSPTALLFEEAVNTRSAGPGIRKRLRTSAFKKVSTTGKAKRIRSGRLVQEASG